MFSFARRRSSALLEGLLVSVLIAMLAGFTGLTAFALGASRTPATQQTLEGTLSVRHGDDFAHGQESGHSYFLVNGTVERELAFNGQPPDDSISGQLVRVEGNRQGSRFLVAAGGTKPLGGSTSSSSAPTGSRSVAIVLFNFSNDPTEPYSPSHAAGVTFTNPDSVAAYYAQTSWGQLTLTGDVFGWYTIPDRNDACAISAWATSAAAAANAVGISLAAYDNVVYAFPYTVSCTWSGLASMPGRSSWLNGATGMTLQNMAHELGHNFGTHHASSLDCTESGVRVALSSSCTTNEYGDPFSVMGSGGHYEHTGFSRGNFGWLDNADALTVTAAGTYSVTPIEVDNPTGIEVLRIPRADTGTYLALEFRQPSGTSFDTFQATDPIINGVTVRLTAAYSSPSQTRLVDATPATSSFADAPLALGQTLVDPVSGLEITVLGVSASAASIQVSFGTATPSSTPTPAPTVTPPAPTPAPTAVPTPTPVATATTLPTPSPDGEAPTTPVGLRAALGKGKKVALSWMASSDNVAVAGYRVFRDGAQVALTSGTNFTETLPGRSNTHTYYVVAYDSAGNASGGSNPVSVTP